MILRTIVLRTILLRTTMMVGLLSLPAAALGDGPVDAVLSKLESSPVHARAAEGPLRRAESARLPLGLLSSKALEGAAKRVPAPILTKVLAGLVDKLQSVRALLPKEYRTAGNIESLARSTFAGCEAKSLLAVLPQRGDQPATAAQLTHDGGKLRRAAALCSDLRSAGLISSQSGVLAVNAVRYAPGDAAMDGALVRAVREAGSTEAASLMATSISAALTNGAGIGGAVGQGLANHPIIGDGPPNSQGNGPPETLNSKAAERAGPPGSKGAKAQGNGPPDTPPGQQNKTDPPGKQNAPGQQKK